MQVYNTVTVIMACESAYTSSIYLE